MTIESLAFIERLLTENNINYEFVEWTGENIYPYFVGEYQEIEAINEDAQESTFILTGFTRGTWSELEHAKQTILNAVNITTILPNGNGIAVSYSNSLIVPTGDEDLKRIQINLRIKEWKV